jgi:Anthranilate synthase component I, N terminal region.
LLTLDELNELAGRFNVFPIISESFNSSETPMGIFRKLQSETGVFLLESAEQGVWSRYSFMVLTPGVN